MYGIIARSGIQVLLIMAVLYPVEARAQSQVPRETKIEFAELVTKIRGKHEQDEKRSVATRLCNVDWPDSLIPQVVDNLQFFLMDDSAASISTGLRAFADRNRARAAVLVPKMLAVLRDAELREKLDLLFALRSIGPPAMEARQQVREEMNHSSIIIRVYAASALASIDPDDNAPRELLLSYLNDYEDWICWRAACAAGDSEQRDPRWILKLRNLIKSPDVRVRVAAAKALWKMTGQIETSLPTLVEALEKDDQPMSTAFIYPSFTGWSHRSFAVVAIGDMGRDANSAVPSVVKLLEEAAVDAKVIGDAKAEVGMAALYALSRLGPDAATIEKVSILTNRERTIFRMFPEHTVRHIEMMKSQ